ncbi:hypothetical protein HPB51_016703 [Rhipicephalus microplus]|uniref:Protein kinase domain-containing protein n=1 Tax=Rhipicephalus microplus TaxID=6941 RepID=A0A9J6D5U7_RHIMP|nr:hypothetical protein HPB51_016703 [Rhipicephalus microplus]
MLGYRQRGTESSGKARCRAADWWSAGVVFYKLTTGRVPFRGKTKQALRERIIKAPLKFPRSEDHPHSATAPAKDIIYRLLKKNPVERLGSRNYSDLKAHPFFEQFDWQMLPNRTDLSDIASIAELLTEDTQKGNAPDLDDQRRHLAIDEMTDIPFDAQKPLLCYASGSFKKLIHKSSLNRICLRFGLLEAVHFTGYGKTGMGLNMAAVRLVVYLVVYGSIANADALVDA